MSPPAPTPPATASASLTDRVFLVTGGTAGVGRDSALALGRMGAQVVVVGRDHGRAKAVVSELKVAGNGRCSFILADLSLHDEIQRVGAEFRARHSRLDGLINNAGAFFATREQTAEGFERTWALNHLGYYRLTHALIDLLLAGPAGRVVNVASAAHKGGRIDWDDLQRLRYGSTGWPAYQQSKFANIVFTAELARRLRGSPVTANCLHPGFVASDFGQANGLLVQAVLALTRPLQISTEEAAQTVVWAATSSDVAAMSGEYFVKRRVTLPDPATADPRTGRRLWEISAQQSGLDPAWPALPR